MAGGADQPQKMLFMCTDHGISSTASKRTESSGTDDSNKALIGGLDNDQSPKHDC